MEIKVNDQNLDISQEISLEKLILKIKIFFDATADTLVQERKLTALTWGNWTWPAKPCLR